MAATGGRARTKAANRAAILAVGLELGQELAERDPPDVEGATAFVTALFSRGVTDRPRRYAATPCAPASPSS